MSMLIIITFNSSAPYLSIHFFVCPSIQQCIHSSIHNLSAIYPSIHLSIYNCICTFTYQFILLSIQSSIYPPFNQPSIYPFTYQFILLSIQPSIYPPFNHPSIYPFTYQFILLSIQPSIYPP